MKDIQTYGKTTFSVAFFGIADRHDYYVYEKCSKSNIMNIVKKDANRLGAKSFILYQMDRPIGHYEKKNGKWYKIW